MSYENYFETIIRNISPTQKRISQASTSHNYIRNYIYYKSKKGEFFPINNSFLTGSYSRHTKIEPLDDIDMFIVISAQGARLTFLYDNNLVPVGRNSLWNCFTDDNGNISSIKVLNLLKELVEERYPKSTKIRRDGQVVNVYLSSYKMGLDIVPAFQVQNLFGPPHFLIPIGHNHTGWMKTNPLLDYEKVQRLHNRHNNKFRGLVKLVKYWNVNCNKKRLRNYHIEAIAIEIFSNTFFPVRSYSEALYKFFNKAENYVDECPDHTNMSDCITSNLDALTSIS